MSHKIRSVNLDVAQLEPPDSCNNTDNILTTAHLVVVLLPSWLHPQVLLIHHERLLLCQPQHLMRMSWIPEFHKPKVTAIIASELR